MSRVAFSRTRSHILSYENHPPCLREVPGNEPVQIDPGGHGPAAVVQAVPGDPVAPRRSLFMDQVSHPASGYVEHLEPNRACLG
jgi:hypothetical protein